MSDKTLRQIDVFISSPGDVREERQAVIRVINKLNRMQHIAQHYTLKPLTYEEIVPAVVGERPQDTIDRYMMKASESDIFICIMWYHMGTPVLHEETGKWYQSGTEYEFLSAYNACQKHGRPKILLYRGVKPLQPDVDSEQLDKVRRFFTQFEGSASKFKGLYKRYKSNQEFEEILFNDLDIVISTLGLAIPDTGSLANEGFSLVEFRRRLSMANLE